MNKRDDLRRDQSGRSPFSRDPSGRARPAGAVHAVPSVLPGRTVNDPLATDPAASVVRILADGRPRRRDGRLAQACAMDGTALDDALERLSRLGVAPVFDRDTVALPRPINLLDPERIRRSLPRLRPEAVHVRFAVDSTNTVLAERLREGAAAPELCTAEIQTAGRGRHGRRWISGLGQSLVLSVSWRFAMPSSALNGLSLAVGVALAEALSASGFKGVVLEWPNDLVVGDRKLAGILVEVGGDRRRRIAGATAGAGGGRGTSLFQAGGDRRRGHSAACVVGVGFNLDLARTSSGRIDRPWTDFARAFGRPPGRNALAALVANAILDACEQYRDHGLALFVPRWKQLDALRDRPVRVLSAGAPLAGVARGIDAGGALLVEHAGGIARCDAGEVRVRAHGA